MAYKILIISTLGCDYDVNIITNTTKSKKIIISHIENIGTLDLKQIFKAMFDGFDGIIININEKIKNEEFISEFVSFDKYVNEANRILEKRGYGSQRVNICYWDGKDYKGLINKLKLAIKKIIKSGPNPINIKFNKKLKGVTPINLMAATCGACNNFHFRSLFKAREKILNYGKFSETEINSLLDSIFEAETWRNYIFQSLKGKEPLKLDEIIDLFDLPDEDIIRDIFYLREQGFIEELNELDIEIKQLGNKSIEIPKEIFKYSVKKIKEEFEENYFKPISIVFDNGICCHCGLCSTICPFDAIELSQDYLYIDESSCITCGLCFLVCPQLYPFKDIYNYLMKSKSSLIHSNNLGYYINIYSARSSIKDVREERIDGNIATTLLYYLLDNKFVDAAITIKYSEDFWKPKIEVIENKSELIKTKGEIYVHTPILSVLDKTKKYENIALVALPCMIKALWKAKYLPIKLNLFQNIEYKIGLFCIETFSYENILNLIRDKFNINLNEISKIDMKKGKFFVILDSGDELSIPLKEINAYGYNFCHYCNDLTAEFADISVGSIGSEKGWSSVITRSKKGESIINEAIEQGLIQTKPLDIIDPCRRIIEKIAAEKRENCLTIEMDNYY